MKYIKVRGARENNLKNIDIDIPRDQFVVITGLSGSGKSSLAFETFYAEGQRRYVESLSAYARQFLGQAEKPDVDSIEGLSPAIAIDQKTTSKNPRSTVGTVTEIYDYLRLLYARIGHAHCPNCGKEISKQSIDQIIDHLMSIGADSRCQILAPIVRGKKGQHTKLLDKVKKDGFARVRIDGEVYDLDELPELNKTQKHNIEIVVDRLVLRNDQNGLRRLSDSIETASEQSEGIVIADLFDKGEHLFSQNFACADCNIAIEEITPRFFSFNSPYGACPKCSGLGITQTITKETVMPDMNLSIMGGGLNVFGWNIKDSGSIAFTFYDFLSKKYNFSLQAPLRDLDEEIIDMLLYGSADKYQVPYYTPSGMRYYESSYEGLIPMLMRRFNESSSESMREKYQEYFTEEPCEACHGKRLKKEALAVKINGKNIMEICEMNIHECRSFLSSLTLSERERAIAEQILKEIHARLSFLEDVGLNYLNLARAAASLSGGEAQRIRLATQIGSRLTGIVYILDEPSIGLHQRDNDKLIKTLFSLRDLGNSLIVVEHDEDTMRAADYVIDIGPAAGVHGGEVVATGTAEELCQNLNSPTGAFLSGRERIYVPTSRRKAKGYLKIYGAEENNLKHIDVKIPLGLFCCVTGVSGSGKSSLIKEIVCKYLSRHLNRARAKAGKFDHMEGLEQLDKIIVIDQSPIGRTPKSNPATYTGVFDLIRQLFASTNDAKARGYKEGRFSFNVKGGRCEACNGDGVTKIEMHFLSDIYVKCEVCKGKKYNRETLEVKYNGKNIYDILEMTIEDACSFFEHHPRIYRKLVTLMDVGLGYLKLGQSSPSLSGGEAQRIKLATELSRKPTGKTIYVLDEPTTGLHSADVKKLIAVLQRLVSANNSMIVIEHNLDVIKTADYIIDMGPEGGDAGGEVITEGTPEQVSQMEHSYTGQYLKKVLNKG